MAPTTRRIAAAAARDCRVIGPTESSKESSVAPEPAPSPSATVVSGDDGGTREPSRTLSPSREETPNPHVRETEVAPELPENPSEPKGNEPCRSPLPVVMPTKVKVEVPDLSGTTVAEASSGNTLVQPPTTPKRRRTIAVVNTDEDDDDSKSPRKRRIEASPIIIKYEPVEYDDDGPPTPVFKYEDSDSGAGEDPFLISSDPQRHYDLGLDAAPIPFQQSFALSLFPPRPKTPPPPGIPLYHPSFPLRRPLRCPNGRPDHLSFELRESSSAQNPGRWFYVCSDCVKNFICWADDHGVYDNNPRCDCGYLSREGISGNRAQTPRVFFYTCATKGCRFWESDKENQLSEREVNEYYGRQIYPNAE